MSYNICLAARSLGLDADYHLVWDMPHGSDAGTSTGTFIAWINESCGVTADSVFDSVVKMDTHLHVDVPMETDELPGPDVDLRNAG